MVERTARARDAMTPEPLAVSPRTELDSLAAHLANGRIRHALVVDGTRLIGIVTDRDLRLATGGRPLPERVAAGAPRRVEEIMSREPLTVLADDPVALAAELLVQRRISALPVLEAGRLVGIVTRTDLLRWIRDSGRRHPSSPYGSEEVARIARAEFATVSPDDALDIALEAMGRLSVRHLPVVERGRLVGLVSDRDLRSALGRFAIADARAQAEGRLEVPRAAVRDLMHRFVVDVAPATALCRAAEVMLGHGIGAHPIGGAGRIAGLVTDTDLLARMATVEGTTAG